VSGAVDKPFSSVGAIFVLIYYSAACTYCFRGAAATKLRWAEKLQSILRCSGRCLPECSRKRLKRYLHRQWLQPGNTVTIGDSSEPTLSPTNTPGNLLRPHYETVGNSHFETNSQCSNRHAGRSFCDPTSQKPTLSPTNSQPFGPTVSRRSEETSARSVLQRQLAAWHRPSPSSGPSSFTPTIAIPCPHRRLVRIQADFLQRSPLFHRLSRRRLCQLRYRCAIRPRCDDQAPLLLTSANPMAPVAPTDVPQHPPKRQEPTIAPSTATPHVAPSAATPRCAFHHLDRPTTAIPPVG
jgi:hypothetical protein